MTGRAGDEAGMTTTQVTILVPAVLFWVLLIVQYGLWYHAKQVASMAADEAVDAAKLPTGSESAGRAAAQRVLEQSGNLDATAVTVHRHAGTVTAVVQGAAPRLVPGFSWTVSARSEGPVERFIPQPERGR